MPLLPCDNLEVDGLVCSKRVFGLLKAMTCFLHEEHLWKENEAINEEHEELLKKIKESQRKVEVAQTKTDDLEQYGRKAMLEINGFPRSAQEDPWKITLDLAKKLDVALSEDNIKACHRISTNDKAGFIIELSSRKKRDDLLYARKTLASISIADFGVTGEGNSFSNESQTAKRKALIRELKSKREEYHFTFVWSKKGTIFIHRDENSRAICITREFMIPDGLPEDALKRSRTSASKGMSLVYRASLTTAEY